MLHDLIREHTCGYEEKDGIFRFKIDTPYDFNGFSVATMQDVLDSKNPRDEFFYHIDQYSMDAEYYEQEALIENLKRHTDTSEDELRDFVMEYTHFEYDPDDLDTEYSFNIMLDTGDANYEFTCNNVLNYCGNGTIDENSSILWLTKQFGKDGELKKALKEEKVPTDEFLTSVIEELENDSCSNSGVVFLVKARMSDIIKIKDKKTDIIIPKGTVCGLYDFISGGGSTLDIQLPSDLKIPYNKIFDIWLDGSREHGYDVGDVYGFSGDCWQTNIKF